MNNAPVFIICAFKLHRMIIGASNRRYIKILLFNAGNNFFLPENLNQNKKIKTTFLLYVQILNCKYE